MSNHQDKQQNSDLSSNSGEEDIKTEKIEAAQKDHDENQEEHKVKVSVQDAGPAVQKDEVKALALKDEGNKLFAEARYDQALKSKQTTSISILKSIDKYEEAVLYCPLDNQQQYSILHSNIAICFLKQKDYDSVIHYTTVAIQTDPAFKKAYLNRAIAFQNTTDKEEEALDDYKEAQKIDPNDKELMAKIYLLEKQLETLQEQQKEEVLNGLKQFGNTILGLIGKFGLSTDNFQMQKNENGSFNIQFNQ